MECKSCGIHVNLINKNWLGIRCVWCKLVFCEPCAIAHFEVSEDAKYNQEDLDQVQYDAYIRGYNQARGD